MKDTSGTLSRLALATVTPDGERCAYDGDAKIWAADVNQPVVASVVSKCEGDATIVKVSREDQVLYAAAMTVEIIVRFQPPTDTSNVPEPEKRGVPKPPQIGPAPVAIAGGTSFNSAVEIESGKTYAATAAKGEYTYFKIPMTWGQQLAYRFRPTAAPVTESIHGGRLGVWLHDPMRINRGYEAEIWRDPNKSENADVTGGTEEVLRATSRKANLDGFYYLAVNFWTLGQELGDYQEYAFVVETSGEIEKGPVYLTGATPSVSTTPESTPTPEPTPLESSPTSEPAPPSGGDGGGSVWPTVGIAAAAAAAGAGAVFLLRRRGGAS